MDAVLLTKRKKVFPGSLGLLVLLLLGGVLFSWVWTQLGYRGGNLERQGIDIVHHALIISKVSVPGGINEHSLGVLADYPNTAHRLAALTLTWFDGDAILAMRFTGMTTVTWLLALQFTLLCRLLPWVQAAILLLLWQWLCWWGMVANPNHFQYGVYNFSRAVGGLGLWGSLVFLSTGASGAWQRRLYYLLAAAGAAFAMACHLVPGAVAFGGIILFAVTGWLRQPQVDRLFLLGAALLAAAYMYWGTSVWTLMVQNAGSDGWLPVGPPGMLLIWVPLAGLAALLLLRPIFVGLTAEPCSLHLPTECLMTALLSAGAVQLLAYVRMVVWGACAPYAVKSVFYYTFPLAALLGMVWLATLCSGRLPAPWRALLQTAQRRKVPYFLAAGLLLASMAMLCHLDRGLRTFVKPGNAAGPAACYYPPRDQLPQTISTALAGIAREHEGWYYFDPIQPFGAFYASIVGLNLDWQTAVFCRDKLAAHDYAAVLTHPGVRGILLPDQAQGAIDPGIPGKTIGRFREYPLAMGTSTSAGAP
jgi:hypothetical protein